ncbi:hypothetical protein QE410_000153 [Microbacterium sp. SORGH_AS 1204]|uniref:hypothetical protein n=1 Tax=Microbacterium sp. SORGH_AS_1204 TaxID=3041785 RepID=UPI00278D2250|nr:hypothetical protein [Microbacterium sp. SORGH_AS_1204]MDQ1135354.1 hypothetical protein [Microbacterium sp. SORGH_AS_1204]
MKKRELDVLVQQLAGDERTDEVRAAREKAKARAHAHPELRLALAEHYRRLGDPAQAGRWGVVFPGWSRPHEIARLRLFLLQHADGGDFVRRYLALWKATPLPPEVLDLVAPSFVERAPRGDGALFLTGCGGGLIALTMVVLSLTTGANVLWLALIGQPTEHEAVEFVITGTVAGFGALLVAVASRIPSEAEKAADAEFAVSRALQLLEQRPAEGRAMLQSLAKTADSPTVRGALVDDARRRRSPTDAGRWGCPEPGLTTPEERDAFASLVMRKPAKDPVERLLTLSAAWSGRPIRGDIPDVLRRVGATAPRPFADVEYPGPALRWWFAPLVGVPLGAVGCLLLPDHAHVIAAITVALMAASWAGLCLVAAASPLRPHRNRIDYAAASAALAATAVGFAIAAW